MGAGGKTTALRRLALELAADGHRVIVTTTTAVRTNEFDGLGAPVIERDEAALTARLREALADGHVAAAARGAGKDGKLAGLLPATVDGLWRAGLADHVLVEADGSKGRPFKAFGPHEPQVPHETTTVVQVAGLDVVGRALSEEVVHRPALLAEALAVPIGAAVTQDVFAAGLRLQIARLRETGKGTRVVTLLNKVDACGDERVGRDAGAALLSGRSTPGAPGAAADPPRPDAVVVASLRRGTYVRAAGEGLVA